MSTLPPPEVLRRTPVAEPVSRPADMPLWAYWDGPMPEYIQICRELLELHNPGIRVLSGADLVEVGIDPEAVNWIPHPQRSDVIRTELLAMHGGMWVDLDCVPMRDFGWLCQAAATSPAGFASYHSTDQTIGYNFVAARADSPVIQEQAEAVRKVVARRGKIRWLEVSTEPLTPIVKKQEADCALWPMHLVQAVSWRDMGRMAVRASDEEHGKELARNPSVFCYMLSHQCVGPEVRTLGRKELLESDRFLSFLYRESFRRAAITAARSEGRAVIVLNLYGDGMAESSRASIQAAARRWRAEYVEVTEGLFGWKDAYWEKLNLDHHAARYERVVAVDRDVVIRDDCPNPFDLVEADAMGAVPSEQDGHRFFESISDAVGRVGRKVGVQLDIAQEYFNSGFLVFSPRRHARIFDAARYLSTLTGDKSWPVYDQGCLALAVKWCGVRLKMLAPSMNRCGAELWERWTPNQRDYVWHFCGGKNRAHIALTRWRREPERKRVLQIMAHRQTNNLGDAMQSYALAGLLGGVKCVGVHRDEADRVDETIPFIVNGYLQKPVPRTRNAVVAGGYIAHEIEEYVEWMRGLQAPVGARDPWIWGKLVSAGVPCEMVGCATLTLPRSTEPRSGVVYVDINHPQSLKQDMRVSWPEQWWHVPERLRLLARAELVITSRLHVALACLALGTPVLVGRAVRDASWKPERFSLLDVMGFRYDEPCTLDVTPWAQRYRDFVAKWVGPIEMVEAPDLPEIAEPAS